MIISKIEFVSSGDIFIADYAKCLNEFGQIVIPKKALETVYGHHRYDISEIKYIDDFGHIQIGISRNGPEFPWIFYGEEIKIETAGTDKDIMERREWKRMLRWKTYGMTSLGKLNDEDIVRPLNDMLREKE